MSLDREIYETETKLRRLRKARNKRKRARLGLPAKRKGTETYWRKGHEYLGPAGKFERRAEVYRNAGGVLQVFHDGIVGTVEDLKPGMCQGCAETHEVGWYEGEWHHNVKTLGGRRCDCAACGLWVCSDWHKRYHNRVTRFGEKV